jgi:hypothetical protein
MTFWRRACLSSLFDPSDPSDPKIRAAACSMIRLPKIDDNINWATR